MIDVSKKKDPLKAPSRRTRAYEMPNLVNIQTSRDPLQQIEDQALQDLNNEYRTIRVEQLIEKKKRDVQKMKEGIVDGGPMASNANFMKMARMMSDLSPEEQKRVANAYAVLRMADRGQVGGSLGLLGPLLGYARQNPGASEEQLLKYLTLMDSQMMKGVELSRALTPGQPEDGTLKLLGLMKEILPLLQSFKGPQQQGIFDSIFLKPEVYNRLRESGIFGGNSTAKSTIDIQLEELRGSRELQIKKWDLEMRRDELKRQAEDRRTDTLISVFGPLASAFAGSAVTGKMRDLGQQQAAAHNPEKTHLIPTVPPGDYVQLQCPCGYRGTEPLADPPQTRIICPRCNQVLTLEIPPTEEKTVGTSVIHSTEEKLDERLV